MDRRLALKNSVFVLGGLMSAGTIITSISACQVSPSLEWEPVFFDISQAETVSAMIDIMAPKTDQLPGGLELGIPAFVDDTLARFWPTEHTEKFKEQLTVFIEDCEANYGKPYYELNIEQRVDILSGIVVDPQDVLPGQFDLFLGLKGLVLDGYFTSEEVNKTLLKHEPTPNRQEGCVDLVEATGGVHYSYSYTYFS